MVRIRNEFLIKVVDSTNRVSRHRLLPLFSYFHLHPSFPRSVKLNIYSPLMFSQGESRKINRIESNLGGSSNLKPVWRGMRFETRNVAAAGRRVITFLITSCMFFFSLLCLPQWAGRELQLRRHRTPPYDSRLKTHSSVFWHVYFLHTGANIQNFFSFACVSLPLFDTDNWHTDYSSGTHARNRKLEANKLAGTVNS